MVNVWTGVLQMSKKRESGKYACCNNSSGLIEGDKQLTRGCLNIQTSATVALLEGGQGRDSWIVDSGRHDPYLLTSVTVSYSR
jgi:hypothetical protein